MEDFKVSVKNFGSSISERFSSARNFCAESYNDLKCSVSNYFKSKEYEEDLDSIIDALHIHMKKKPSFNFSENFEERLKEKKEFLFKQSALFAGLGALGGAWKALESGAPQHAGKFAIIGATGAVIIIVVTATGVFVKRALGGSGMEFSKSKEAYQILNI